MKPYFNDCKNEMFSSNCFPKKNDKFQICFETAQSCVDYTFIIVTSRFTFSIVITFFFVLMKLHWRKSPSGS